MLAQPHIMQGGKHSGSVARRTGGLIVVVVVVVLTDEKGVEARFMPISHTLSHPLTPSHTFSHPLTGLFPQERRSSEEVVTTA